MAFVIPPPPASISVHQPNLGRRPMGAYQDNGVLTFHPDYQEMAPHFLLAHDAYFGTGVFLNAGALDRFSEREQSDRFSRRKNAAYYINWTRPIVDIFANAIFGAKINRVIPPEVSKINSTHGDWDQTLKFATTQAKLYGLALIHVGRPGGELKNLADQQANPPFLSVIPPQHLIDWCFVDGEFQWIKVIESSKKDRGDWRSPTKPNLCLRIWTKDSWYLYEEQVKGGAVEYKEIDDGKNSLGLVPFVPFWSATPESGSIYGPTEALQMARVNRRIYNQTSEIDDQMMGAAFNILTAPMVGGARPEVEIGSATVMWIDYSQGGDLKFVAPSPEPVKLGLEAIETYKRYMYEMARLDSEVGIKPQTATERIFVGEEAEKSIRALAAQGQAVERQLVRMVLDFEGLDTSLADTAIIEWPTKYDQVMADNAVARAIQILSIRFPSTTANKAAARHYATSLVPMSDEERAIVLSEINNSDGQVMIGAEPRLIANGATNAGLDNEARKFSATEAAQKSEKVQNAS